MIDRLATLWNQRLGPLVPGPVKVLWAKYAGLAMPVRLLIGALISAVGGSGLLGFLSEYAAYSYAIFYGIRPPVEGVPYLRVAVTTSTMLVFLLSSAVFFALLAIARLTIAYTYRLLRSFFVYVRMLLGPLGWVSRHVPAFKPIMRVLPLPEPEEFVRRYLAPRPLGQVLLIAALVGIAFGIAVAHTRYVEGSDVGGVAVSGLLSVGLVMAVILLLWRPVLVPWIATIGTLLFFLSAPFGLFHAPSYAHVLRLFGYGGGLPVRVHVLSDAGTLERAVEGYLMLRTTTALLLYDREAGEIVEVPVSVVGSLSHEIGGLTGSRWRLPVAHSDSD